jgi:predicted ribosome quality control (RQC) complex YloA/Tae2 family protein
VALDRWLELLVPVPDSMRARVLMSSIAYSSPLNAAALLGIEAREPSDDPGSDQARPLKRRGSPQERLTHGWRLWTRIRDLEEPRPCVLSIEGRFQPYPYPLHHPQVTLRDSLLDAFAEAERMHGSAPAALLIPADLLAAVERERRLTTRKVRQLKRQLAAAPHPAELRELGNLLLARLRNVPRGARSVELEDFQGHTVHVELDPALEPHENAASYFERASRAERAREGLPGLVAAAEDRAGELHGGLERARQGLAGAEELRALLGGHGAHPRSRRGARETLPYRRYRSSGGLEILVGRSARANDDLTFHHSHPDDVWLHARHAAGAHVVLRWRAKGAPPARDLYEAGVLAAVHSRARTSGSVPVDWTRRKYVRKPRGAAPGAVIPERVQTLFVEPDPQLAERLEAGRASERDGEEPDA